MSRDQDLPNIPHRCSFCGKGAGQVKRLFSGHESFICDECVELCYDLIQNAPDVERPAEITDLPTPEAIKQFLDQYVIGQENAKRTVAVAVYNHYKRINDQVKAGLNGTAHRDDEVELEKSNILLLGPTGTGKTLIARSLAKFLKVPFTIADATVLTEAGYVGEDVENILVRLYQASNFNQHKTERGIIYIDELDKISRKDGESFSHETGASRDRTSSEKCRSDSTSSVSLFINSAISEVSGSLPNKARSSLRAFSI